MGESVSEVFWGTFEGVGEVLVHISYSEETCRVVDLSERFILFSEHTDTMIR